MSLPLKAFVIAHTHWDREWYLPYQEFRIRLVKLVDMLLEILRNDKEFKCFMLDGQTILLEDYLEICPQKRKELEEHISSGRILVGPWFVLPDEFLVSPESLIRNLQLGHQTASSFGGIMKVGYLPDTFGHINQMPQILQGFGIDTAVIWRGVDDTIGKSEFTWRAPDGSEVLAIWLPDGYANASVLPESTEQLVNKLRQIVVRLDEFATTSNVLLMNGNDHIMPDPELPNKIANARRGLFGIDILQGTLPQYIAAVKDTGPMRRVGLRTIQAEFRSSKTSHLLSGVLSSRMWIKQQNHYSQNLLEKWAEPFSAFAEALTNASGVSSMQTIEAKNRNALIAVAWRYLLQNHPHDSICGCSVDQVHDEMKVRFDWCNQITQSLVQESLESIGSKIDTSRLPIPRYDTAPVIQFAVFNSGCGPRTDFVKFVTQLPATILDDFILTDDQDNYIPCQIVGHKHSDLMGGDISREEAANILNLVGGGDTSHWTKEKIQALEGVLSLMLTPGTPRLAITGIELKPGLFGKSVELDILVSEFGEHNYPAVRRGLKEISALVSKGDVAFFRLKVKRRDEVEIGFVARHVPAFGYKTYQISAGHRSGGALPQPSANLHISNEFFAVQANALDGSLSIIDKETGSINDGLNLFIDGGDAGDEYNYSPPTNDTIIAKPAHPPRITVPESGAARSSLKIEMIYELPALLAEGRQERSGITVEVPITSTIYIYPGIKRIDIRTEIENKALDHRLRVHFPARIRADRVSVETHFDVVPRLTALPPETSDWIEQPSGTKPQRRFVDVSDGTTGLMIANRGIPEYEAIPGNGTTTVALTLLRSIGWLSRDDLRTRRGNAGPMLPTPGAQCLGPHSFEYSIIPHSGFWHNAISSAHWFDDPMKAQRVEGKGTLPLSMSLMDVQPESLIISSIKKSHSGEGLLIRLYNPSLNRVEGTLTTTLHYKRAIVTNLNEEPQGLKLPTKEGSFPLSLGGGEIITLILENT